MKQIFVKAITLLTFMALIAAFVLYRSGAADELWQQSPNGSPLNSVKKDSSQKKQRIMSSSKSIILSDPFENNSKKPDSARQRQIQDSILKKEIELMGSSKSTIIYKPKPVVTDSAKNKK